MQKLRNQHNSGFNLIIVRVTKFITGFAEGRKVSSEFQESFQKISN